MTTEEKRKAQTDAQRRYRQKHPERIKEYLRKYREKNKEKLSAQQKQKRAQNPEKFKEIARKSYQKHKEIRLVQSKEYNKKNRAKVTKMINKRRKEVAIELSKKGQIYTYLNKSARESKMVSRLAIVLNISEESARQLLLENEWNYKKLTEGYNDKNTI